MKKISIYNKETKIVVQNMTIKDISTLALDESKFDYIEGLYEPEKYKVVDGVAQLYTKAYASGINTTLVRKRRNILLQESDWTQVPDSPLSDSKKAEWATYRQQLRDMMSSYTDSETNTVENITWPTRPS